MMVLVLGTKLITRERMTEPSASCRGVMTSPGALHCFDSKIFSLLNFTAKRLKSQINQRLYIRL